MFFAFAAKPPTEVTTGDVLAPATDGVTTALIDGAVAELVRRRNGCPDDAGARVSCLIGLAVEAGDRLHDKLLASRAAWQETQPAGLAR